MPGPDTPDIGRAPGTRPAPCTPVEPGTGTALAGEPLAAAPAPPYDEPAASGPDSAEPPAADAADGTLSPSVEPVDDWEPTPVAVLPQAAAKSGTTAAQSRRTRRR